VNCTACHFEAPWLRAITDKQELQMEVRKLLKQLDDQRRHIEALEADNRRLRKRRTA
tara:strand:+ start:550 stop:720 length:171 start_codon:yes stop_codon:yes gene_type:complete